MGELILNNGKKAKYIGTEMSGDVYEVMGNSRKVNIIDISNGSGLIDFHTVSGDYEPDCRVGEAYQPKDQNLMSSYGKLFC